MKIKGKVLSFVLTLALAFTCVAHLFGGVAGGNPMTKNTYNFSAFAGEDVELTTGIGATKYMVSTDGANVLLATEFNVDVANYKEVGYLVTKTGEVDAVKHSCGANFYTGITVRTGETTTKDWTMAQIFGETDAIGMIVAELDYADANAYSFVPYMVNNDDVTETGAGKTVAAKYDLTLENATVAKVNGEVYTGNATRFAEGTQITVKANDAPAGQMFVRFDADGKTDNLVGEAGNPEYTFTMGAKATSLTAVYADADKAFLSKGSFKVGTTYQTVGWTGTKITESTDADLQGLSGYSFTIPNNTAGTDSVVGNITATKFTTWGIDQTKIAKFILKNHGAYDVTVELQAEYFGSTSRTGNIVVPANSVVTKYMTMEMFLGKSGNVDMGIHEREDMTGDGNGTIQLDVVAEMAKKYTSRPSDLIAVGGKYMQYGEITEYPFDTNGDGEYESPDTPYTHYVNDGYGPASFSNMTMLNYDSYGVMYFYNTSSDNLTADAFARVRGDMLGDEAINFVDGASYTFYVKVTNLSNNSGKFTLAFTRGSAKLTGGFIAQPVVSFDALGQVAIFKVTLNISGSGSGNLQMGLKRSAADSTGSKLSILVQIATENIFGELTQ